MQIKLVATAGLVTAALGFAACGGGDDTTDAESQTFSAADVTDCFGDAGQKVREVEVSFAKIPPDLGVSSQAGGANIWITDDTQAVVDQAAELAKLDEAESLIPIEDRVVESGNLIAVVDSNSSPDYRATIEGCIPPA
jgi:hypothetical protein